MILSAFVLVIFGFSFGAFAEDSGPECVARGGTWHAADPHDEFATNGYCTQGTTAPSQGTQSSQTSTRSYSLNPSSLGKACGNDTESALVGCNFDSNPAVKTVMAMANSYKQQLEAGAASSQANLCSKMGNLAQAINGAVGAYSTYCSSGYASCQSSCEDDLKAAKEMLANPNAKPMEAEIQEKISEIHTNQRKCGGLASNLQNVQQSITGYTQIEQMKSQFCGQALANTDCKANPANPACQQKLTQDCSDPAYAATATVCVCMKNPADARCGSGSNSNFLNGANSKTGAGFGGGADGKAGSGDFGGLNGGGMGSLNDIDPLTGKPSEGGGTNLAKGGANRANLDVGGGGNPAAGGKGGAPGAAGSGINTKIIGGYGFGNSGGGGYAGGSGSNGSAGAGYGGQRGVGPNGQNVDLRQFMPGGKMDPSRALAGVSGPDGITGPNSDIWQKIRVRYFSVSPSLLP